MNAEPFVVANDLGITYANGLVALDKVDLEIRQGEFVAVVGASGCGKSTLLKALAGLLLPTQGALTVAGRSPLEARQELHDIAFVFQDPTLLSWRTVRANVHLPLELQPENAERPADTVDAVLAMVGLGAFADAFPAELSGGMRMRVSLARALITRPDVLLLDEPFGALDEITRRHLNEELIRLWLDQAWTAVFVTHNVTEAAFLSSRVLAMSSRPGRVIADVRVPLPYPRTAAMRTSPEFNAVVAEISECLRQGA